MLNPQSIEPATRRVSTLGTSLLAVARFYLRQQRRRLEAKLENLRSVRGMLSAAATGIALAGFLWIGLVVLGMRPPRDTATLRAWLSGGIAIYLLYHFIKTLWAKDIESPEESCHDTATLLWLGGAPVPGLVMRLLGLASLGGSAMLKTFLLVIPLQVDARDAIAMAIGVFLGMLTAEVFREAITLVMESLGHSAKRIIRGVSIALIATILVWIGADVLLYPNATESPLQLAAAFFGSLGHLTETGTVSVLAIPLTPSADFACLAEWFSVDAVRCGLSAVGVLVAAFFMGDVLQRFRDARQREHQRQWIANADGRSAEKCQDLRQKRRAKIANFGAATKSLPRALLPPSLASLLLRQALTAKRYAGQILVSLGIPVGLCLSPMLTRGLQWQWLFVVGGVAFCTAMLAPSALKIDFRRDWNRLGLLRSLPVRPWEMVLGQIGIPVLLTWVFQAVVLIIAIIVLQPTWTAALLWLGMLSALAIVIFALENSLFLWIPRAPHQQRGIGMLLQTKLMFIAKTTGLLLAFVFLSVWSTFCQARLPPTLSGPLLIAAPVIASWSLALAAIWMTAKSWQRTVA